MTPRTAACLALTLLAACGQEGAGDLATSADAGREGRREHARTVVEFERMTGVARPYTGAANALRGVPGGGLPWVLEEGEAKLDSAGVLRVKVEGLVFDPDDQAVIDRGLAGQNTVPAFRAILSCQTIVDGAPAVVNLQTAAYPATTGPGAGDAEFSEALTGIPSPCYAPIVFVTSPAGAWFAASSL